MNEMTLNTAFAAISAALFVLILAAHVLSSLKVGRVQVVISLVAVGLHIPLMPLMLLSGFTLEIMILAYMLSAFVFTLMRYVVWQMRSKNTTDGEEKR